MRSKCGSWLWVVVGVVIVGCSQQAPETVELRTFPIDDMTGILTQTGVAIDNDVTTDGRGSLRISADEPVTIRLFETGDVDVENATLFYQASLRTEDVKGQVYLEMWCHFPGSGEYFSRSLHSPIQGTTDWTMQGTPFLLKKRQNPDNIKLNLVIAGTGTAWVDDVRLVKGPLQ